MQCTSYIPVYYHSRDLNVGSNGYSWHLLNSNANYGEQNGNNISLPSYNMEQYSCYDKEALKQIIQNHDATFRYQVQELHRLYRRQRELMDEMKVRKMFAPNLLSQTSELIHSLSHVRSEISQAPSHVTSWLLGDHSHNKLSELTAENFQEHSTVHTGPFIKKNSYNEVKFLLSRNKGGNKNRIGDLEYPADVYSDDKGKQFGEINELANIRPSTDSEIGSFKAGDLSSFNLSSSKSHCLIDLNEPIQLEPQPSTESIFLDCDGRNSSVDIDLNSMPDGFFSETENLNHHPVVESKTGIKFLNTKTDIDLNTDVVLDEPCPSTVEIKASGGTYLEGPVSPENEECSPPRGKSEDTRLEKPSLLSEQGNMELEIIAAQTLVTITSINRLSWFAEIICCATGDDLGNETMNLDDNAVDYNDQDLKFSKENGLNVSRISKKEKEAGTLCFRSRTRRQKDSQTEALHSLSKNVCNIEGFIEKGRGNANKKASVKPRKCSDRVKKSMSSIMKQPATRSKQGVLQSWGKIKKREGGLRRRASRFIFSS